MKGKGHLPYECPECGADLQQPTAVEIDQDLPVGARGHVNPGVEGGVVILLDFADENPVYVLTCAACGTSLDLVVEDVDYDDEFVCQADGGDD